MLGVLLHEDSRLHCLECGYQLIPFLVERMGYMVEWVGHAVVNCKGHAKDQESKIT